jgi:hypothetical protein
MQQTIPVNDRYTASYVGSTPSTGPFAVDFPFFSLADVVVTRKFTGQGHAEVLVRGADYELVGVATEDGSFSSGTITLVLPTANATIARYGSTTIERLSNFPLQGFFSRLALNAELNRITVVLQEQEADQATNDLQALKIPEAEAHDGFNTIASPAVTRRGRLLAWDATGNLTQSTRTLEEIEAQPPTIPSTPLSGLVNVLDWGAVGDGITDDTEALQAALGTGHAIFLPCGRYLVTSMLVVPNGSGIFGETKMCSRIVVDGSFNMLEAGVIRIGPEVAPNWPDGNPGTLKDFTIEFIQPNVSVRASVIQYPWAIMADAAPRTVIQNIRIVRGWKGISMCGGGYSTGGCFIDGLEASCFHTSVKIDEVLDVMHFSRFHLWAFGCLESPYNNLFDVMKDGQTIGLEVGRCDTLLLNDFFAIQMPRAIWIHQGSVTPSVAYYMGNLTNIMLDDSGIVISQGTWNVSNLYVTPGDVTDRVIDIVSESNTSWCYVNFTGLYLRFLSMGPGAGLEAIRLGAPASASSVGVVNVNITNMMSTSHTMDRTHIKLAASAGGNTTLLLNNAHILCAASPVPPNYTKPKIHVTGGARAMFSNISGSDFANTGDLIKIDADEWVSLSDITTMGYQITGPANATTIQSNAPGYIQTYTPTVTAQSGTLTSYTSSGRYSWFGKRLKVQATVNIGTNGTAAGALIVRLPGSWGAAARQTVSGQISGTGVACYGVIDYSQNSFSVIKYDGTYPGADGVTLTISGEIEVG